MLLDEVAAETPAREEIGKRRPGFVRGRPGIPRDL
jgi:hypothetical protein